jgi:hypothetical protein
MQPEITAIRVLSEPLTGSVKPLKDDGGSHAHTRKVQAEYERNMSGIQAKHERAPPYHLHTSTIARGWQRTAPTIRPRRLAQLLKAEGSFPVFGPLCGKRVSGGWHSGAATTDRLGLHEWIPQA